MPITVGISTKTYLGYRATLDWLTDVVAVARAHEAITTAQVRMFVAVPYPMLEAATRIVRGTGVMVAAQDVGAAPAGAHTGDVPASLLAELGVELVEVGHAERRADHRETDTVVEVKVTAVQDAGMVPLLCVGELERGAESDAVAFCLRQLRAAPAAPLVIAYEPVWAIGADAPADASYVRAVVDGIRAGLALALLGTPILYGGSAGPGLLGRLRPAVDGLFLGRFAHDPGNVRAVLDEAAVSASSVRPPG